MSSFSSGLFSPIIPPVLDLSKLEKSEDPAPVPTPVLYTTHCAKCEKLKQKLDEKGIRYIENTDVNQMLQLGIQSAPALKVQDKILVFHEAITWVKKAA
jgi:hypothetical protein